MMNELTVKVIFACFTLKQGTQAKPIAEPMTLKI